MTIGRSVCAKDIQMWRLAFDLSARKIFAGQQQSDFGGELHPPVRWLDLVDRGRLRTSYGGQHEQADEEP